MKTPTPNGERDAVAACPRRGAGPGRPAAAGRSCLRAGSVGGARVRKWSCDCGRRRAARRRTSARRAGGPAANSPDRGDRQVQTDGQRPAAPSRRVGWHRQQQLVVLAAVQGQGEAVAAALALQAGRAGSTGSAVGSTQADDAARLAQRRAGRPRGRPRGPWRRARGRARPGRGAKASGGAGSSWARRQRTHGRGRRRRSRCPWSTSSPSASQPRPVVQAAAGPRPRAPSVPVTTTRSPGRAPERRSRRSPVAEQRHVDDDRPRGRGQVAAHDVHARLRRALEQAVVEPVHELERDVGRAGRG